MLIDESQAGTQACHRTLELGQVQPRGQPCLGSRCMAWREVKTQLGPKGYCGLAGMPANVAAPLLGQTIETALSPAPGQTQRLVLPQ